jgi:photosystem II stability/assembly factor-like uncharacterized protein
MTRLRRFTVIATVLIATSAVVALAAQPALARDSQPSWHLIDTGTTNHFRGLSVVSREVVWLGGYAGQVLRTIDGGRHWSDVSPAGARGLQFRDIQAFDADHAVAMAAGARTHSQLFTTFDGGAHWQMTYENRAPTGFFDCMAFFNGTDGLVLSDPVDGRFRIIATHDGGRTWSVNPSAPMPAAQPGEAAFAASGECLTTAGHDAWFGSGGISTPRIYHSSDSGRNWTVTAAPIVGGATAGVFALAFRTPDLGVATGGDFAKPNLHTAVAARKVSGQPWQAAATQPAGYRSGVTWVPYTPATFIAVGLNGSDVSYDGGANWAQFATGQFDTVSCAYDGTCMAAGDLGRVALLHR